MFQDYHVQGGADLQYPGARFLWPEGSEGRGGNLATPLIINYLALVPGTMVIKTDGVLRIISKGKFIGRLQTLIPRWSAVFLAGLLTLLF
jgi:hypothetical protein